MLHAGLHGLNVSEQILYKLAVSTGWYVQHKALQYLCDYCSAYHSVKLSSVIRHSSSTSTGPTMSSLQIRPLCFHCMLA